MSFTFETFPNFLQRFVKIMYGTFCIIGSFYNAQAYAGSPFTNNHFNNGADPVIISCTITDQLITIKNANTTIRVDNAFHIEMLFSNDGQSFPLTKSNESSSVSLLQSTNERVSFRRKITHTEEVNNKFGKGKIIKVEGLSSDGKLVCSLSFEVYYKFPNVILAQSSFKNISGKNYPIQEYTLNQLSLCTPSTDNKWWSFQGASYYWQQDFAFQLPDSFKRDNYMGLNDTRVGGGLPIVDVWNKKFGLALAYIGKKPREIYMPVRAENGAINLEIKDSKHKILKPNDSLISVQTAIIVHKNDFYDPLRIYGSLMNSILPHFKKPVDYAYQTEWCTWGYKQKFTPQLILNKLDRLKALGIKSVIIDDGWSIAHGDWIPDPSKFPNGDEDFKRLIKLIHEQGLKVWLWWVPGYTDSLSHLAAQHPDWLIKNKDGSIHPSFALCAAYPPVQEHYRKLVQKFVATYKLDGFKLDFQEINSAPPCYNPAHHHKDPFESYYATPTLFETIYQTAVHYKPDMLIEYCSCSIPPNIFHLPWMNLAVTSDPKISQITSRIKMYKALMGDDFPVLEEYCGVIGGPTYQLVVGTGGVPGTFSTYLDNYHDKWLTIYRKQELSKGGQYLNLYDIGLDYPEAHVIKKDSKFYYAFYTHPWNQLDSTEVYRFGSAPFDYKLEGKTEYIYPTENFSGKVEFRGLNKNEKYKVFDYGNNKELGIIEGDKPFLNVSFDNYLLLEVTPVSSQ